MARKKLESLDTTTTPAADPAAAKHLATIESTVNERMELVVAEFGDGLPWHADHYEAEIRADLRHGCEAFIRAGRRLVVARECATHGEWQGMLERLGISQPQAHRMMETARRLANHSTSNNLVAAAGSTSKLIELLSLPEEQFAELANEGATGDLEIDDIADMKVNDLRAAVRRHREEIEKKEELLATEKENHKAARREWVKATPDAKVEKLRGSVRKAADEALRVLSPSNEAKGLFGAIQTLLEDENVDANEQADFLAGVLLHALGELRQPCAIHHVACQGFDQRQRAGEVGGGGHAAPPESESEVEPPLVEWQSPNHRPKPTEAPHAIRKTL